MEPALRQNSQGVQEESQKIGGCVAEERYGKSNSPINLEEKPVKNRFYHESGYFSERNKHRRRPDSEIGEYEPYVGNGRK
jgi:hypothetical protein